MYGIQNSAQCEKLQLLFEEIHGRNIFQSARFSQLTNIDNESFVDLPLLTKQELVQDQIQHPPFGSNLTYPLDNYIQYHQTSGSTGKPLRVLDTKKTWEWWINCWLEVFRAAGVSGRDRVFFAFSFAPFIGFWSAYHAISALGAMVIPGGGMNSQQRL